MSAHPVPVYTGVCSAIDQSRRHYTCESDKPIGASGEAYAAASKSCWSHKPVIPRVTDPITGKKYSVECRAHVILLREER